MPAAVLATRVFFKQPSGALSKGSKGQTYMVAAMADLMRTSTPKHPAPYPFNLSILDQPERHA